VIIPAKAGLLMPRLSTPRGHSAAGFFFVVPAFAGTTIIKSLAKT
jgi:hypothetical protein